MSEIHINERNRKKIDSVFVWFPFFKFYYDMNIYSMELLVDNIVIKKLWIMEAVLEVIYINHMNLSTTSYFYYKTRFHEIKL